MRDDEQKLRKIGVFYDGNFFFHVSTFYRYVHVRQKRISIPGLHEFIRHYTAKVEGVDVRYCQIVESHFFRGRLSAREADARQKLYVERVFDDILMGEGVITHYLPMRRGSEKGIDVWLALEAFEQTLYKHFDVLVLIAGDSDFVPLARKVNSLGTRIMVLGWDFVYTDATGQERETVTSKLLLDEVSYPVMMNEVIDDAAKRDNPAVRTLFVGDADPVPERPLIIIPAAQNQRASGPVLVEDVDAEDALVEDAVEVSLPANDALPAANGGSFLRGEIFSLHAGFGFIKAPNFPNNAFFHFSALSNKDFNSMKVGDVVRFSYHLGDKGPVADEVEVERET
jgi:cold shock CspA family protein